MYTYEITTIGVNIYKEDMGIPMPENPTPKEYVKSLNIEWSGNSTDDEKILLVSKLINSMNEVR